VHASKAPASRRHRNETPASASAKLTDALVAFVCEGGPESIVGSGGGVRSIVHANVAGEPVPALDPAGPSARTWNVCEPAASGPGELVGLVQAAKAAPSSLHSKVAFAASAPNAHVALCELVGFAGPLVIDADGTTIDHPYVVSGLVCPDFTARTRNVWAPAVSPV
jgi:hypothetical protein